MATIKVNIYEAKTNLSKLLEDVRNGKDVIIANRGKAVAVLTAYKEKVVRRNPGSAKGKIKIGTRFFKEIF